MIKWNFRSFMKYPQTANHILPLNKIKQTNTDGVIIHKRSYITNIKATL